MMIFDRTPQGTLPGPEDIFRKVLPNGITLLARRNFNSPSVYISGYVAAGSYLDPIEKLGLAHFTSTALMRGTKKLTFQTLYDKIESAGASLGFGASVHNTNFSGRALAEDLPLLVEILSDCLRNPTFPKVYIDRLKTQLLTSLAIREQDTAEMSAITFDSLLFGDHPYGKPEDGFVQTIQAIEQKDLQKFHEKFYQPQGMVIVVVGAVEPQQSFEIIESRLADWENSSPGFKQVLPSIQAPKVSSRRDLDIKGKSQTDLVMGTLGPKRASPDYLPASLGNNILGQFGMMGRIGEVVREKAGLAYFASTSLNAWIDSGSWEVSAGVNPVNLEKAIHLISQELARFIQEPVTKDELEDSQANFIGRLPLSLESNAGMANSILNLERFNLGLDYFLNYSKNVKAVTPSAILEVARKYIDPEKLVTVSAGSTESKG